MRSLRQLARTLVKRIARGATNDSPPNDPPQPRSAPPQPTPPPKSENSSCRPADLETLRTALFDTGRPLLANHWATWCDGCVEELPLLVELHSRIGDRVDFLGVSWDGFQGGGDAQELCRQVEKFAQQQGLPWESLLVDVGPEELFEGLAMDCHTVPQLWLINASGEVVHRVEQVLDDELLAALERAAESL